MHNNEADIPCLLGNIFVIIKYILSPKIKYIHFPNYFLPKNDGYGLRTLPNAVSARLGIIFKNFKDECKRTPAYIPHFPIPSISRTPGSSDL